MTNITEWTLLTPAVFFAILGLTLFAGLAWGAALESIERSRK